MKLFRIENFASSFNSYNYKWIVLVNYLLNCVFKIAGFARFNVIPSSDYGWKINLNKYIINKRKFLATT